MVDLKERWQHRIATACCPPFGLLLLTLACLQRCLAFKQFQFHQCFNNLVFRDRSSFHCWLCCSSVCCSTSGHCQTLGQTDRKHAAARTQLTDPWLCDGSSNVSSNIPNSLQSELPVSKLNLNVIFHWPVSLFHHLFLVFFHSALFLLTTVAVATRYLAK